MNRREFLRMSGLGFGAASGLATNLASFNAYAADTSGYKALVCIFLAGGQDGHDLIIPWDISSSQSYENIRAPIIDTYAIDYASRRRSNLLSLQGTTTPADGTVADGRAFAMAQEMGPLRDLYLAQKMAVVGNVGPLLEPTTAATYASGSAALPPRLFSHNDQQSIWMASNPEGAQTGWGGKFGDLMQAANANAISSLTSVRTQGDALFVTGLNTSPFSLSTSGGLSVEYLDGYGWGTQEWGRNYGSNLFGVDQDLTSPFRQDIVNRTSSAIEDNQLVSEIFANGINVATTFPDSNLGNQLKVVAQMIANRDTFGMKRQIFIVQDGGYDTHSNQGSTIPERQSDVANAMRAFYDETVHLGIEDDVCQFTASDFGRTLVPNGSGTDHGWGSHHLVLGGSINGGYIYGDIPPAELGHDYDLGRGRLVPQLSVDQYAFALARWFGLSLSEALEVLPNASNFNFRALYGLYSDEWDRFGNRV